MHFPRLVIRCARNVMRGTHCHFIVMSTTSRTSHGCRAATSSGRARRCTATSTTFGGLGPNGPHLGFTGDLAPPGRRTLRRTAARAGYAGR
ncbi:hypothetical protein WI36_26195 [Burkholderia ubonensis]|nr:hypothetical protein WI36_26195 [Burkholderia ubonensis]